MHIVTNAASALLHCTSLRRPVLTYLQAHLAFFVPPMDFTKCLSFEMLSQIFHMVRYASLTRSPSRRLEANKEEYDLDDEDIDIIRKNRVPGLIFLKLTEAELATSYKLPLGPAARIEKLIKELIRIKDGEGIGNFFRSIKVDGLLE